MCGSARASPPCPTSSPFPAVPSACTARSLPAGDQPAAIEALVEGLNDGLAYQTLLGVTGSGKTYTMANVIARTGRPALVIAPNKTLAAQLYSEMREFFPENAVEYFVSYYDYYQPEAYVPSRDLFIEKDSSINEHIEQLRLSATKSVLERPDTVIVATVSCIYGIGDPEDYQEMRLILRETRPRPAARPPAPAGRHAVHEERHRLPARHLPRARRLHRHLPGRARRDGAARRSSSTTRSSRSRSSTRSPGASDRRCRASRVYAKSHYVTPRETVLDAIETIKVELRERLDYFQKEGKLLELQRLQQRTHFDLEMMNELGFCKGIENYSRHLSGRAPGEPPPTLIDYLPSNALLVIDESHVTIPQVGGMYNGDRSRKETLVAYGFRLPSALDNRPLKFEEFERQMRQAIFVSATPSDYESTHASQVVEQVVRPTGLVDPQVTVRPASTQVDDLLSEVTRRTAVNERVLVTTLTKRMAEDLTDYLAEHGVKVRYLHSDIDTVERVEIIRDLRKGLFDVLVGINLLREGLDLPEVSLVAILDADKEGFLRSARSLIQTIGRAARHINGARDPLCRPDDRLDGEGHRRDRAPACQAGGLQPGQRHRARRHLQAHQGHDRRRVRRRRGQGVQAPSPRRWRPSSRSARSSSTSACGSSRRRCWKRRATSSSSAPRTCATSCASRASG